MSGSGSRSGSRIGRRRLLRGIAAVAGAGVLAPAAVRAQATAQKTTAQTTTAQASKAVRTVRRRVVVLDAGHGGVDPGAIGLSGIFEKDIALATTRLLARELEATKRYQVYLTRDSDEFIPLHDRVTRARAANGELFLSIHADALPNPHMRGASVFTLSEKASDAEAAALAQRENKVDLIAGIDLSRHAPEVSTILIDLARRQTNNLSIGLARRVVSELGQEVPLLANTHRSAGFAVLKAPDIPSALIELGCLSNKDEEKALRTPSYRAKLAASLARSVHDYFELVLKA